MDDTQNAGSRRAFTIGKEVTPTKVFFSPLVISYEDDVVFLSF
jgi:hypothetical protein